MVTYLSRQQIIANKLTVRETERDRDREKEREAWSALDLHRKHRKYSVFWSRSLNLATTFNAAYFHKNILFPIKYVNHLTTVKIVYTNVCTTKRGKKTHGCHVRPRTVGKRFDTWKRKFESLAMFSSISYGLATRFWNSFTWSKGDISVYQSKKRIQYTGFRVQRLQCREISGPRVELLKLVFFSQHAAITNNGCG